MYKIGDRVKLHTKEYIESNDIQRLYGTMHDVLGKYATISNIVSETYYFEEAGTWLWNKNVIDMPTDIIAEPGSY